MYGTEFLAPEYSGGFNRLAKAQMLGSGYSATLEKARIRFTPLSGVLLVKDRRQSQTQFYGWDTGYSRVYFASAEARAETDVESRMLVVVWDSTDNKSKLIRVTVPDSGAITQSSYGLESPVNDIWASISVVNSYLYVFDLNPHKVIRFSDSNSDGNHETLDPNFSVQVPVPNASLPIGSPNRSAVMTSHPIIGFEDGGVHGIFLRPLGRSGPARYIKETSPGVFEYVTRYVQKIAGIVISSLTTISQQRLRIVGTPGYQFKIMKRDTTGTESFLSNDDTIPENGICFVVLQSKLVADWIIWPVPTNGYSVIGRPIERKVTGSVQTVLFPVNHRSLNQNTWKKFPGDKFSGVAVAGARFLDQSSGVLRVLAVRNKNGGSIEIKLPLIGSAAAQPPFSRLEYGDVWLVDQSGNIISNTISLGVYYE